eukprot:296746-Chlamydomonas_euryale.AAC.2
MLPKGLSRVGYPISQACCRTYLLALGAVKSKWDAHGLHHLDLCGRQIRIQVDWNSWIDFDVATSATITINAAILAVASTGTMTPAVTRGAPV